MRVELPRRPRSPVSFLLLMVIMMASCARTKSFAQAAPPKPHATLVFFADQKLQEPEWSALFDALHGELRADAEASSLPAADAEFLRGDSLPLGLEEDLPIVVYLHGNCTLVPWLRSSATGALGWVRRVHGHIEPFIHVDCAQITQELGPLALGMNRHRREVVMGEALAHVVLHEWIHVATQNPGHTRHGVAKAHFGVADLLAHDAETRRVPQMLKRRWKDL